MMVLATRCCKIEAAKRKCADTGVPTLLSERSMFVGEAAFAAIHFETMDPIHWTCYRTAATALANLQPHSTEERKLLLFIDAEPELCLERVLERDRDSESDGISLDYLRQIHEKHHTLVAEQRAQGVSVATLDGRLSPDALLEQALEAIADFRAGEEQAKCSNKESKQQGAAQAQARKDVTNA